ncbi:hypothetical protein FB451DRAFT_315184 [Mycena latifolia]|nr:hypothetical protein FB451DRAFT_315184 [Mycena latifolia]
MITADRLCSLILSAMSQLLVDMASSLYSAHLAEDSNSEYPRNLFEAKDICARPLCQLFPDCASWQPLLETYSSLVAADRMELTRIPPAKSTAVSISRGNHRCQLQS